MLLVAYSTSGLLCQDLSNLTSEVSLATYFYSLGDIRKKKTRESKRYAVNNKRGVLRAVAKIF